MNFDPIGNSSQQLCRQSTALPFHSIRFEYQINTALDLTILKVVEVVLYFSFYKPKKTDVTVCHGRM